MMVPYQMSQALIDQRTRELVAAAERRQLLLGARHGSPEAGQPAPRRRLVAAALMAVLPAGRGARAGASARSASGGPVGCAT